MTKKLMLGAALSALLVCGALAQQPAPSPNSNPPAAAQNDKAAGKLNFVTSQKPDQWLASRFRGTNVLGPDNKKIGDVSDILFDKTGKVEAFVISVGGFLGVGSKEVALTPASFDVVPGENGGSDQLKLSASKDELKQAQNFAHYAPPHTTTTGTATRPLGSPNPSNRGPTKQ